MGNSALTWAALIGILLTGVLFAVEVRRWRSLGRFVGKWQKTIRTSLIVLIEILFLLMLFGPHVAAKRSPVAALVYWGVCVAVAFVVLILAAVDLKYVLKGYIAVTKEI
ncbi:MAG: hypothetical protein QHI38_07760, partial [Armatimonadota bacterium]|nr:hypothetical protein [Armatimonadota bacterium]